MHAQSTAGLAPAEVSDEEDASASQDASSSDAEGSGPRGAHDEFTSSDTHAEPADAAARENSAAQATVSSDAQPELVLDDADLDLMESLKIAGQPGLYLRICHISCQSSWA